MTKKQEQLYNNYLNATMVTIYDAYDRPSQAKLNAYEDCKRRCLENNGGPWCIPSRNSFQFSFAYTFHKDNEKWLHYETATNVYEFNVA